MKRTVKELRQRKFYLVVPFIALPFITMAFWALGGGTGNIAGPEDSNRTGLIMDLPDAVLPDDSEFTKLDYYNLAMKDSLRFKEQIRNDPNYRQHQHALNTGNPIAGSKLISSLNSRNSLAGSPEKVVFDKLGVIEKELAKPPRSSTPSNKASAKSAISYSADIERLEQMMSSMTNRESENKELQELNEMLQTILDIQHPERVENRLKEEKVSDSEERLTATSVGDQIPVSLMSSESYDEDFSYKADGDELAYGNYEETENGFYSFSDWESEIIPSNTIKAVVHETQTLINGSLVKLRLSEKMAVGGVVLPRNSYVYGLAQLSGERLKIRIESISSGNYLLPVQLSVYDLDGQEGIYIPGTITQESAKQSADRSLNLLGLSSMNSTFGAQAASAGISAAKTLLSKNLKPTKVTLNTGYQVLILDNG